VNAGGALVVAGSSASPVNLRSDAATPQRGDWYFLRAFAGAQLRLTYCTIAHAGRGGYPAVMLLASDAVLSHCRIYENAARGVSIEGAGLTPLLEDTTVDHNTGEAIVQSTIDMNPTYRRVTLSDNGSNTIIIPGGTLTRAATLDGSTVTPAGAHLIVAAIAVGSGGTLTVTGATTVRMAAGTQVDVREGGALLAEGSAAAKIAFTSAASPQAAGDWYYVRAEAGARLRLTHADIGWAGRGGNPSLYVFSGDTVVQDTRIHDAASRGVWLEGTGLTPALKRVTVAGCAGDAVYQSTINMAPTYEGLGFAGNTTNALVIGDPTVRQAVTLNSTGKSKPSKKAMS